MKHRLSGPLRMWIVIAATLFLLCCWWVVLQWPSAEGAMRRRIDDTNDLTSAYWAKGEPVTDPALVQHLDRLAATGHGPSIRERNEDVPELQEKYSDHVDFKYVEERYRADLMAIDRSRIGLILRCLGVWLLPQIIVGASIATTRWVRAGYKRS